MAEKDSYNQALEIYRKGGDIAAATGASPDRFLHAWDDNGIGYWLPMKPALEQGLRVKLPDINPDDAVKLARETVFSAEQWYRGCTDPGGLDKN